MVITGYHHRRERIQTVFSTALKWTERTTGQIVAASLLLLSFAGLMGIVALASMSRIDVASRLFDGD
jgi:hypothetical protein